MKKNLLEKDQAWVLTEELASHYMEKGYPFEYNRRMLKVKGLLDEGLLKALINRQETTMQLIQEEVRRYDKEKQADKWDATETLKLKESSRKFVGDVKVILGDFLDAMKWGLSDAHNRLIEVKNEIKHDEIQQKAGLGETFYLDFFAEVLGFLGLFSLIGAKISGKVGKLGAKALTLWNAYDSETSSIRFDFRKGKEAFEKKLSQVKDDINSDEFISTLYLKENLKQIYRRLWKLKQTTSRVGNLYDEFKEAVISEYGPTIIPGMKPPVFYNRGESNSSQRLFAHAVYTLGLRVFWNQTLLAGAVRPQIYHENAPRVKLTYTLIGLIYAEVYNTKHKVAEGWVIIARELLRSDSDWHIFYFFEDRMEVEQHAEVMFTTKAIVEFSPYFTIERIEYNIKKSGTPRITDGASIWRVDGPT